MVDRVLQLKGEAKTLNIKIVENDLYILPHTGCGFDSYVVFIILPQWRTVVSLFKNGSGIVSLKILKAYVNKNKKIP